MVWAALAALAVHALAVLAVSLVSALGGGPAHARLTSAAAPPGAPPVDLQTTCRGDALLATTARAALCLGPWAGSELERCLGELEVMMRIDLSACEARTEPIAAVAVLAPQVAARVPPIDPEQLVEELATLERQPPPPPPMPQPQPQQQPPPPPPPPPAPPRPQQVIETAKPSAEQEPDNARFLAEHNTRVEKQTVARGARNEPMVAKSQPEELRPTAQPKEAPDAKATAEDRPPGVEERAPDAPGKLAMRAPGAPGDPQESQEARVRGAEGGAQGRIVADGFVPRAGDAAIEQQRRDPGERTKGQGGAGGGAPRVPDLRPSQEVLERALGGGSVDHLEDVESGEETALTAKRWVYAGFFNRLKRQVAQNWDPQTVWRRSDPTGARHGLKTRVTEVRVSLTPRGDLAGIIVTSPSGVGELDVEAVRAFRAAGPFPNPPEGLVKGNQITFAFSFFFEIGQSRTSWRVPRN
jgi:TonB family protein